MALSEIKVHAMKTLECFDELARPEIQNKIMGKVWDYVRSYTAKVILRKPDEELKLKLKKVHNTLGPLFKDSDMAIEIAASEALGSPPVPNVGELARIKKLATADSSALLEELGF